MPDIENIVIDLDKHQEYPDNYNEHPEAQIQELMESLRQFGQPKSIVVWHDQIVAGNGIAKAARRLGWKRLDARRLPDDWPEYKVKAYCGADNELARGASANLQALAALAAEVRKEDETLARLAAGGAEMLAELMAMDGQFDLADSKPGGGKRDLGNPKQHIKPVLYVDQVKTFEQAIRAVGTPNRGEALMEVCRFYLEKHGTETGPKGQLDFEVESGLEALTSSASR